MSLLHHAESGLHVLSTSKTYLTLGTYGGGILTFKVMVAGAIGVSLTRQNMPFCHDILYLGDMPGNHGMIFCADQSQPSWCNSIRGQPHGMPHECS